MRDNTRGQRRSWESLWRGLTSANSGILERGGGGKRGIGVITRQVLISFQRLHPISQFVDSTAHSLNSGPWLCPIFVSWSIRRCTRVSWWPGISKPPTSPHSLLLVLARARANALEWDANSRRWISWNTRWRGKYNRRLQRLSDSIVSPRISPTNFIK